MCLLSIPSSALSLGNPEEVPAAQAPKQGKSADVAALDAGAPPPPPSPFPPAANVDAEKEVAPDGAGAGRMELDLLVPELPEGEPIVPPLPPDTILPLSLIHI